MTTQLGVYNQTLVEHLGERKLTSLTDTRAARRKLDVIWDNGFVDGILEDGQWNFAIREGLLDYNSDYDPEFGYQYVFDRPTDWIRTTALSIDETFNNPLLRYSDVGDFISCDMQSFYMSWVSNGSSYGGDLTRWPKSFTDYAASALACRASMTITQNARLEEKLEVRAAKLLKKARSKDALNQPTKFLPKSSWLKSRSGNYGSSERGGRV